MKRKDLLRICLQNLMRRKSRTFLTVLGVLIGCCSIVIMVSLGIGMRESQERTLAQMGDLTIITVTAPRGGRGKVKLQADPGGGVHPPYDRYRQPLCGGVDHGGGPGS